MWPFKDGPCLWLAVTPVVRPQREMPSIRKSWTLPLRSPPEEYLTALASELRAGGAWNVSVKHSTVFFDEVEVLVGRNHVAVREGSIAIADAPPYETQLFATVSIFGALYQSTLYNWFGARVQSALAKSSPRGALEG